MLVMVSFVQALRAYRRARGKRIVTCPETERPAAVEIDAVDAARAAFRGSSALSICDCSRWPERADCAQACVAQIEADPEVCRVRAIAERWYTGKHCVYCRKPIDAADWLDNWFDHKPALLDAAQRSVQWNEVAPEDLPEALQRLRPVCWSCHEMESFRREHPDLVIDRPPE